MNWKTYDTIHNEILVGFDNKNDRSFDFFKQLFFKVGP